MADLINITDIQANETNVDWYADGERANALVLNRPIKQISGIVNEIIDDLYGTGVFLRKDVDDTASGLITFENTQGIEFTGGSGATGAEGRLRYNNVVGRFEGYTDSWKTLGGATGGGTDQVFYENDTIITADYTITAGKNAMTAGPISLNEDADITVPDGSEWVIV